MGYLKAVDIEAQHIMTVKQTLPLTGDYVYYSKFQLVPWLLQLKAQKDMCHRTNIYWTKEQTIKMQVSANHKPFMQKVRDYDIPK